MIDRLTPMDRYVLRVLAQRSDWAALRTPPELVPALVSVGYVDAQGNVTREGRAAAQPSPLTPHQLERRRIHPREAALARRVALAVRHEAPVVLREAGMPEECPRCLGLGVVPPGVYGVLPRAGYAYPTVVRLYPRVRPEDVVHHWREPGWRDLGWSRCPCRPPTESWTPPPAPDRSPVADPRPLDVVGTRRVVAVEADAVSWDTPVPYGARTYTDGTWERARWERWARRQWVQRWAEDWTVPAWMRPIVGRPRR